jgi:choloylglycine hydrolase
MKKIIWLLAIILLISIGTSSTPPSDPVAGHCTIFTAAIGDTVLFGNSEDYFLENTFIWFVPAQPTTHGYCAVGFDDNNDAADGWPQGGMNDEGLCLDANGLPPVSLAAQPSRTSYPYGFDWFNYFLRSSSTVEDIIQFRQTHGFRQDMTISWQEHWADATGDAVVVSVGTDEDWAFTRMDNSTFLVSTNWNLANPDNGWYPCGRYETATLMLSTITQEEELTVEAFRDILDAVHQEGLYASQYSNVFDLVNRDIYLYHYYDFEKVVKLNLDEELAKGAHRYKIADLLASETNLTSSPSSEPSSNPPSSFPSSPAPNSPSNSLSNSLSSSVPTTSASSAGFKIFIAAIGLSMVGIIAAKRNFRV